MPCNLLRCFSISLVGLASMVVISASASVLPTLKPAITYTQINPLLEKPITIKKQAALWGIKLKDYQHYLWLMENTPSGHWYKNLDPAEVLGLNANDSKHMLHYAKVQARNMHVWVTRELAFNKLYTRAYKTLYPNEKPVMTPDSAHLDDPMLQSGDRVWLFVGLETPLGHFVYQHLIKAVRSVPGTVLDIYFVGPHLSAKQIQRWAISMGISRAMVNHEITLNMGNQRFKMVTQGKKVLLPFVGMLHHHRFQPISLSSVL